MLPIRYHDPDRLLGAADVADEKLRGSLNAVRLVQGRWRGCAKSLINGALGSAWTTHMG